MTDALGPLPEPAVMVNRYGHGASTSDGDGGVFTAAQMGAERRRCYELGAAKARAESEASPGPLPVGLLTDGESAAVRAWAEDYAAAEVAKARADERAKWAKPVRVLLECDAERTKLYAAERTGLPLVLTLEERAAMNKLQGLADGA